MKDWHAILGVSKTCSLDEIKSAYRKKAFEYHPDRNSSAEAKSQFIEIDTAYRVLSDPNYKAPTPAPPPKSKPKPPDFWDTPDRPFQDSMEGSYFSPPDTGFKDSM